MTNRRTFLKGVAGILPAGIFLPVHKGFAAEVADRTSEKITGRDYYKEIGVKPFINIRGSSSSYGGRPMRPEVIEAMNYARKRSARMKELNDAVGKRIASLIGCEAAMVSAGACSAITLATAACITGTNRDLIIRVPDLSGMKDEVIVQKGHRNRYDHAVRNCGVRMIEVETVDDVKRAINKKTAMMYYSFYFRKDSKINMKEYAALGKKYHIPTFIDGAAYIPPMERLSEYLNLGFDLAAFSGGKGLHGPYSAGLLLGRKDLIEAALLNNSPNSNTIGRGMKVSKEEILGTMVAVEVSLKYDYSVDVKRHNKLLKFVYDKLESIPIPGVKNKMDLPENENSRSGLRVYWDKSVIKKSVTEVSKQLLEGEPSVVMEFRDRTKNEFEIEAQMLKYDEVDILVRRIREVLRP